MSYQTIFLDKTSQQPNVAFNATSYQRNVIRRNVVHPSSTSSSNIKIKRVKGLQLWVVFLVGNITPSWKPLSKLFADWPLNCHDVHCAWYLKDNGLNKQKWTYSYFTNLISLCISWRLRFMYYSMPGQYIIPMTLSANWVDAILHETAIWISHIHKGTFSLDMI